MKNFAHLSLLLFFSTSSDGISTVKPIIASLPLFETLGVFEIGGNSSKKTEATKPNPNPTT